MAELIRMPTLGFDMEEGTMGVWLKSVGDAVAIGDVLAEIESDKVTQELQARHAGVLLAILANEGDIVPVGADLGIIGAEGEDISGLTSGAAPAAKAEAVEETVSAESAPPAAPVGQAPAVNETVANEALGSEFPGGVKATPVARRIAQDKGIDLSQVTGTGAGGRVRKADVEAFVPGSTPAPSSRPVSTIAAPSGPDTEDVEISRLRKAIARRMTESKQTVPHFQVTSAIDMTDAMALRKQINAALPEGEKVSVNDIIVKASALALVQYPNLNSSWGGDKIVRNNRVNVGTAVAVEGGLLTIVQHNTDLTSLAQVARDNKEKIARARSGKVQAEDIQGSTFSVSNLGAYDVHAFTAIINPPESAILAVGSAAPVPAVHNGEIVARNMMYASVSADHRVTDGAEAAQFMQTLKVILETPMKLLV